MAPGYASTWGDGPSGHASLSGFAASFGVALGGTPWDGVVVAGLFSATLFDATFDGSPPGAPGDARVFLPFLGPIVDWYPRPRGWFHAGGGFGFGGYSIEDWAHQRYTALAPAGRLFTGLSSWIGSQSSIQLDLVTSLSGRAAARMQRGYDSGYTLMTASVGLEWAFLYH